jgi:hypothetical protein
MGPRAGLDAIEKRTCSTQPGLELRIHGHPVAIPTALSRLLDIMLYSSIKANRRFGATFRHQFRFEK